MSRHRAVRNLNLEDELADEYAEDDFDFMGTQPALLTRDDLSPEDHDAMEQSLATVLDTLGDADFSERSIKQVLWDTYFNAEAAIDILLREKEKSALQARKKAGTYLEARHGTPLSEPFSRSASMSHTRTNADLEDEHCAHEHRGVAGAASTTDPQSTHAPIDTLPTGKKPSKLQQKLQASRAKALGCTPTLAHTVPAPVPAPAPAPQPPPKTHAPIAPSNAPLDALFPPLDAPLSGSHPPSSFVRFLKPPMHRAVLNTAVPRVSDEEMSHLRSVFSQLSPDDLVLQARHGTRLARSNG